MLVWLSRFFKKPKTRQMILEEKYQSLFIKSKKEVPLFLLIQREQLESLLERPIQFLLIQVGKKLEDEPFHTKAIYAKSDWVLRKIQECGVELSFPIVLVCEFGNLSSDLAQKCSDHGYTNVVVLDRGLRGAGLI